MAEKAANKNLIIGIVIAVALVLALIIIWFSLPKEKPFVSEKEIMEEETTEELLGKLTPKEAKPLTEEEKEEQKELLERLTPTKPKPMTEEEEKEIEELLKKLTP